MNDPVPDAWFLRHTLATLAYRLQKVATGGPPGFSSLSISPETRTPGEVLAHIADLMDWALTFADGKARWAFVSPSDWDSDVDRVFVAIRRLDERLASTPGDARSQALIFQGPIADALTHVGQLAMLRRLAGNAVRPESYARAEIVIGRVGLDQSGIRTEFDYDASKPPPNAARR